MVRFLVTPTHTATPPGGPGTSEPPPAPESWFNLPGTGHVTCSGLVETDDITVFVWLRLAEAATDIQTIAANRMTNCGNLQTDRVGWSFSVNSPMTSDRKLTVRPC